MIDRRTLLSRLAVMGLVGAMATGAVLPRLQGGTDREAWRRKELADAWRRAASSGRPVLAIVIPEDPDRRWFSADIWGEVITHGSDEAIAALSAAELVCATQAEIAALVPDYAPKQPAPMLVRLDAAAIPVKVQAFQVTIPAVDPTEAEKLTAAREAAQAAGEDWWGLPSADDLTIDARIAGMEAMILSAIQPTAASRQADLAARRRAPITGSRWMVSGGCASSFETPDPLQPDEQDMSMMVGCGMGHVSARSQRFLDFLTEPLP